ncbi:radical SAM family heme chaperone HemW [Candidatus Riflebacteria bacterium]
MRKHLKNNHSQKAPLGIYIHIPFCPKKCAYCDFISHVGSEEEQKLYISALLKEIRDFSFADRRISTIFIGGGTPLQLGSDLLHRLLSFLHENLYFSDSYEWTVECNPETVSKEKIGILKTYGVNRVSLGVQSFLDRELQYLGRVHNSEKIYSSFDILRTLGISNINLDLMIGLPLQQEKALSFNLNRIQQLKPEHVSVYILGIEKNTELYRKICSGGESEPVEDIQAEHYSFVQNYLQESPLVQYEISNYCIQARECLHNIRYWENKEVLGFGQGAWSYLSRSRTRNYSEMEKYLKNPGQKIEEIKLSFEEQLREDLILGLRLVKGVSIEEFMVNYGVNIYKKYRPLWEKFRKMGFLLINDEWIKINPEKFVLSNEIFVELI